MARSVFLVAAALSLAASDATAVCDQPDAPDCACFDGTPNDWDAGGVGPNPGDIIQDIAIDTVGTHESCACPGTPGCTWTFDDTAKPFYQIILGMNREAGALTAAYVMDVAGPDSFHRREEWCSETIAYWHREAGIPYFYGGYRNDWHLDWQNYCVAELKFWYQIEEIFDARGRWLDPEDIDYSDFELGVTVPVPGAYVAIRKYLSGTGEWGSFDFSHSLMINEMWVHSDALGRVFRVKASLLEGNSSHRVKNSREWEDIADLLPGGSATIGADWKIYGFGIDRDAAGDPIYDPTRLHFVSHPEIIAARARAVATSDREWDDYANDIPRVVLYASLLSQQGGPRVTPSKDLSNLGGIPDGSDQSAWHFPAGLSGDQFVEIDLLDEHPIPIQGIELRWGGGPLPTGYAVQFAGADGHYQDAQVPDLSNFNVPQSPVYPISARFANAGEGVGVRYVKLVFPDGTFRQQAVLQELRFHYDHNPWEDWEDAPVGVNYAPDCSGAYALPDALWPPDHGLRRVAAGGVFDPDGDPLEIRITGITQDEPVDADGRGDGATFPDGLGVGAHVAAVRSERQGAGNGRVYEISFDATDPAGGRCSGSVQVCVPHDRGKGSECVDDDRRWDSTAHPLIGLWRWLMFWLGR